MSSTSFSSHLQSLVLRSLLPSRIRWSLTALWNLQSASLTINQPKASMMAMVRRTFRVDEYVAQFYRVHCDPSPIFQFTHKAMLRSFFRESQKIGWSYQVLYLDFTALISKSTSVLDGISRIQQHSVTMFSMVGRPSLNLFWSKWAVIWYDSSRSSLTSEIGLHKQRGDIRQQRQHTRQQTPRNSLMTGS